MLTTLLVIVGSVIGGLILIGLLAGAANAPTPEQKAEEDRQREKRADAKRQESQWIEETRSSLVHSARGRLIGRPGKTWCVFGLDDHRNALRIHGYTVGEEFAVTLDATVPMDKIISLDLVRPLTKKRVKRKQLVSNVTSNKKSPVARGLVGGALLGPAGLVLGAASGAGKDVSTKIEERDVWHEEMLPGEPELHIGTSDPDSPLIKVKPDWSSEAEEWLYRLRAVQSGLGGAYPVNGPSPLPEPQALPGSAGSR